MDPANPMNVKQLRTTRGPRETTRPPATLLGRVAVLALTLTLAALATLVFTRALAVSGRLPPPPEANDPPTGLVSRQAREIEALQRRIAALSARLALATSCGEGPSVGASRPLTLMTGDESRAPADGSRSADTDAGAGEVAVIPNGREADAPAALSTTWGTETFLRELARTSAAGLSLDQAVCADDVCRLSISGRGKPADDALALQTFVGRTAEWLPGSLIQPGVPGAPTVVLLARPGHDLPPHQSADIDHGIDRDIDQSTKQQH